ncbi:hypothetical protein Athai_65990 [Actinocatenispora thailandica]|uniref:Uncharacterized protein n=2 Tax=Actinocatenispora thailandica TaxID=227318 RepID=A0A7R7I0Y3_9ACTN|nr:hypothetical protein Athai_65990 [Actinocatenispora thailandica]
MSSRWRPAEERSTLHLGAEPPDAAGEPSYSGAEPPDAAGEPSYSGAEPLHAVGEPWPAGDEPLRDALDDYVRAGEPPMRVSSASLIVAGRRDRRRRRLGALVGTAALMVLVLAGAVVGTWYRTGSRPAPAERGGSTADRLDAALRAALPHGSGLTLRSLYPADGNTALPATAAGSATAWYGTWESTVDGRTEEVRLALTYSTGPLPVCPAGQRCRVAPGPYGTRVATYTAGDTRWATQLRGAHLAVRVGDRSTTGRYGYDRAALTRAATSAALTAPVPAALRSARPHRHGPAAGTRRAALDTALRADLPGGAALRAYRAPVPLAVSAAGPSRLPDARAGAADAWYADWTVPGQPGAPRLALLVTLPGGDRLDARQLCAAAGPTSYCHAAKAKGGQLVSYEVPAGGAVERAAALLRPDGSRVLLTESVLASVDFPFAAADLAGVVTDPALRT